MIPKLAACAQFVVRVLERGVGARHDQPDLGVVRAVGEGLDELFAGFGQLRILHRTRVPPRVTRHPHTVVRIDVIGRGGGAGIGGIGVLPTLQLLLFGGADLLPRHRGEMGTGDDLLHFFGQGLVVGISFEGAHDVHLPQKDLRPASGRAAVIGQVPVAGGKALVVLFFGKVAVV